MMRILTDPSRSKNVALHVIDDTKWFLQLRRRNLSFAAKKNIKGAGLRIGQQKSPGGSLRRA